MRYEVISLVIAVGVLLLAGLVLVLDAARRAFIKGRGANRDLHA